MSTLRDFMKVEGGVLNKEQVKFTGQHRFQSPALVVGWSEDIGKLGPKVIDILNKKLGCEEFCQVEPAGFFPFNGVVVEGNVAQFPESRFYCSQKHDLVIFKSAPPRYEWHKFLNSVLDVAGHCKVKEMYIVGGIASLIVHTDPRRITTVVNKPKLKEMLRECGLETDINYETPPGGAPTLSSYLLWVAKKRNIPGANLWGEVPFYLAALEDPRAWKRTLEFFDERFSLGISLGELDEEIERQTRKIEQARIRDPEVNEYIGKLEQAGKLTWNDSEKLVKKIEEFLRS